MGALSTYPIVDVRSLLFGRSKSPFYSAKPLQTWYNYCLDNHPERREGTGPKKRPATWSMCMAKVPMPARYKGTMVLTKKSSSDSRGPSKQ